MPHQTTGDLVIDGHCHIGRGLSGDELIEMMSEAGVAKAVVFVTPFLWGLPGQADYHDTNDYIAEMQRQYPDRLVGFACVNPHWRVLQCSAMRPCGSARHRIARRGSRG